MVPSATLASNVMNPASEVSSPASVRSAAMTSLLTMPYQSVPV